MTGLERALRTKGKDLNNSAETFMMILINFLFKTLCDLSEEYDIYEAFNMYKQNNKCEQYFHGET